MDRVKGRGVYYEYHHILPGAMGGTLSRDNMVLLTGREHFIAHLLLVKCYPLLNSMRHALWRMVNSKKHIHRKVTSCQYEFARQMHAEIMKEKKSEITKKRMSAGSKGHIKSAEHRRNLSLSKKGKPSCTKGIKTMKPAWNRGKKSCFNGRKMSEIIGEEKAKIRADKIALSKTGKKRPDIAEWNRLHLKGRTPWNKGKVMSQKYCEIMSNSHKGIIPWNKGKSKFKVA